MADTCQHARDRSPAELASLRTARHPNRYATFCGEPAKKVSLPDSTTGYYCDRHAPQVVARIMRRLALKGS